MTFYKQDTIIILKAYLIKGRSFLFLEMDGLLFLFKENFYVNV